MRRPPWTAAVLAVTLMLAVTACGGGGTSDDKAAGGTDPNGTVSVYGTEPETDMLPANFTDLGTFKAMSPVYAGLVSYRPDTGAPFNLVAESITSSDAKVYDIKLKKGWKFHDGTEVKAKNFVDAWNWGAYGPNGQLTSDFFAQIDGFDAVNPGEGRTPTADKMSGLKVVGDHEFQVALKAPFSVFPAKVGYHTFMPLPDAFFKDPKAFAAKPIGNGPLKFVSRTPNTDIKLTRYDEYQGEDKVKFKDLVIKIYQSQETAYQDVLGGNLDFLEALPPSAVAGGKYKQELGDRVVNGRLLGVNGIAAPLYVPAYNNLDLRKAISLAINREQIAKTVLNDNYVAADGYVSPGIEGYRPGVCGEFCGFDPVRAKEYLARSGFTGKLTIFSNADGGRKEPMEAACISIKNALGVECDFVPATNFGQYRKTINSAQLTGLARSDWSADYPSIENFLNPIVRTGASSNDSKYSNPEVDRLLTQADSTADKDAAIRLYQQAEELAIKDLPKIPTWVEKGVGARSENLKTAGLDFRRLAGYSTIEVAAK